MASLVRLAGRDHLIYALIAIDDVGAICVDQALLTREAVSNGAVFVELIGVLFRRSHNEIEAHIYLKGFSMSSRSLLPCHLLSLLLEHSWLVYIWCRPVATRSDHSLPGGPCW